MSSRFDSSAPARVPTRGCGGTLIKPRRRLSSRRGLDLQYGNHSARHEGVVSTVARPFPPVPRSWVAARSSSRHGGRCHHDQIYRRQILATTTGTSQSSCPLDRAQSNLEWENRTPIFESIVVRVLLEPSRGEMKFFAGSRTSDIHSLACGTILEPTHSKQTHEAHERRRWPDRGRQQPTTGKETSWLPALTTGSTQPALETRLTSWTSGARVDKRSANRLSRCEM